MTAKTFEVRDRATFLPVLAVRLEPRTEADRYLLARTGYGRTAGEQSAAIVLWQLSGGPACHDVYDWTNRTMLVAHDHIIKNFEMLESGDVIDVEFILHETSEPKVSEAAERARLWAAVVQ